MRDTKVLSHEAEIVWEVNPATLPYVRSTIAHSGRRRGPVRAPAGRRVGYANLRPDAPSDSPGNFTRRVFWVKEHDRADDPNGTYVKGCPVEAVDPLTVAVGVAGEITDRAWGAPVPDHVEAFG
jgi:hypothetical protein